MWKVTPDGHLIRPIRMRPLHPLPLIHTPKHPKIPKSETKSNPFRPSKPNTKGATTSKKKLVPLRRARHTIIDPTRYGAQHKDLSTVTDALFKIAHQPAEWEYDQSNQRWIKTSDSGEVLAVEDVKRKQTRPNLSSTTDSASFTSATANVERAEHEPTSPNLSTHASPLVTLPASVATAAAPPNVTNQLVPFPGPTSIPQKETDELAVELADEKAKGLAIMRGLLTRGWAVDLDELEHPEAEDAGGKNVIVRRLSADLSEDAGSVDLNDDGPEGDDESNEDDGSPDMAANEQSLPENDPQEILTTVTADDDDNGAAMIAHAVFDDASSSDDSSASEEENIEAIRVEPRLSPSQTITSTAVVGSSSSPSSLKAPLPATQQQSASVNTGNTQSKSLKEMFAPREEEGTFPHFFKNPSSS